MLHGKVLGHDRHFARFCMQCMRDGKLYWRGDGVDDMHALLDRALFGVDGHLA